MDRATALVTVVTDRPRAGVSVLTTAYLIAVVASSLQGKWSPEEDEQLRQLVQEKGNHWMEIGRALSRMAEACRDRWRSIHQARLACLASFSCDCRNQSSQVAPHRGTMIRQFFC